MLRKLHKKEFETDIDKAFNEKSEMEKEKEKVCKYCKELGWEECPHFK